MDFLSLDTKHNIQQYNNTTILKKHSSSTFFYFLLRLSLSLILSHTQKQKSKSIFPITVAKHGGARGKIDGFMQGFNIRCPRGTCGHGVCRCGRREEEKWISSIPITHQNISTSTHFMMGDWDLISANKSRPYGFECTV